MIDIDRFLVLINILNVDFGAFSKLRTKFQREFGANIYEEKFGGPVGGAPAN